MMAQGMESAHAADLVRIKKRKDLVGEAALPPAREAGPLAPSAPYIVRLRACHGADARLRRHQLAVRRVGSGPVDHRSA